MCSKYYVKCPIQLQTTLENKILLCMHTIYMHKNLIHTRRLASTIIHLIFIFLINTFDRNNKNVITYIGIHHNTIRELVLHPLT